MSFEGVREESRHCRSPNDLAVFGKVGTIGYVYDFNLVISWNVLSQIFLRRSRAKSDPFPFCIDNVDVIDVLRCANADALFERGRFVATAKVWQGFRQLGSITAL